MPSLHSARVHTLLATLRWGIFVTAFLAGLSQAPRFSAGVLAAMLIVPVNYALRMWWPIPLDRTNWRDDAAIVADLALSVAAVAVSGVFDSPYLIVIVPILLTTGLARGYRASLGAMFIATSVLFGVEVVVGGLSVALDGFTSPALVFAAAAITGSFARGLFSEVESRREQVRDEVQRMETANQLLLALHTIAQTLPASLDLADVTTSTRARLRSMFGSTVIVIFVADATTGGWRVESSEGVALPSSLTDDELPSALRETTTAQRSVVIGDLHDTALAGCAPHTRSAMYAPLRARGHVVGLLALEHIEISRYSERDSEILDGIIEALALSIDNALWFRRLRTLGAEAERARIARDLHDRIAQSLSFVAFELERHAGAACAVQPVGTDTPTNAPGMDTELLALCGVVRGVLGELRETLYMLRATVTEETDLEQVINGFAERFRRRTGIAVDVAIDIDNNRLPITVEQELWRILQEAMVNVERHAEAHTAAIMLRKTDRRLRLEVTDDGRGFDMSANRRERFGLIGMYERADAIGAHLAVESAVGTGTRILVDVEVGK